MARTVNKSSIAWIAFAALWPIASYPGGITIPELGVHSDVDVVYGSNDTPVAPQVIRRFDGSEAVLHMGSATLVIASVRTR
jgi:hypothetical protein